MCRSPSRRSAIPARERATPTGCITTSRGRSRARSATGLAACLCLCGRLTTLYGMLISTMGWAAQPVSPAYRLAAWSPRPTPTRQPTQSPPSPTPASTVLPSATPTMTPTRSSTPHVSATPVVSPIPLPSGATIRIQISVALDGPPPQPFAVIRTLEVHVSDWMDPAKACRLEFEDPCLLSLVRR